MADPGNRIEGHAEVVAPQMFEQALGDACRCGLRRRSSSGPSPVMPAASAGLKPAQRHGKRSCCRTGSDGRRTCLSKSRSSCSPSRNKSVLAVLSRSPGPLATGWSRRFLQEPAVLGPAPLDAPGDAAAGKPDQPDGVLPVAGGHVMKYYQPSFSISISPSSTGPWARYPIAANGLGRRLRRRRPPNVAAIDPTR